MNENNEKKLMRYMYITVICAIVILVAIAFNGTYAFFVATVTKAPGTEDATTNIQAGAIAYVTITGDTDVEPITNMIPGDIVEYDFTLTNNDNFAANDVTIVWKDVINNFGDKENLIYTLTNTTTNENIITEEMNRAFPSADDEEITNTINLNNLESNNFKLTIIYRNDPDNNQMIDEEGNPIDMGKDFSGSIEIKLNEE